MATTITAQTHAQDMIEIARNALGRILVMQLNAGEKHALDLADTALRDLHASLPQDEDSVLKLRT